MSQMWAVPQIPRCYVKRNAANRRYRNDWCDIAKELNNGEADCSGCSIARCVKSGDIELKPGAVRTDLLDVF